MDNILRGWLNNVKARFAELITINGCAIEVTKVGEVIKTEPDTPGHNRYGRLGLTLSEAFELTYYRGMLDALSIGRPLTDGQAVMEELRRESLGVVVEIATPEQAKELLRENPTQHQSLFTRKRRLIT